MAENKVLIVEDDRGIAENVRLNLSCVGYDCRVFNDGKEAADCVLGGENFDIAVLDIMLPGMDGFALLNIMNERNIPVIYMTAKTDLDSELRALREGAEDYIVKPFRMPKLMVRIEKILERKGRLNKIYRFEDIILDGENRIITKAGAEVKLAPLEFDVFQLLIKNKNRAVSRNQILDQVWGEDYFGDTRTLDVRIANIRKKLGLTKEIRSISKVGYRLEEGKK